jgi:hypothetical protein
LRGFMPFSGGKKQLLKKLYRLSFFSIFDIEGNETIPFRLSGRNNT